MLTYIIQGWGPAGIKAAVLAKYKVTEEAYRLQFRGLTVPSRETVRET